MYRYMLYANKRYVTIFVLLLSSPVKMVIHDKCTNRPCKACTFYNSVPLVDYQNLASAIFGKTSKLYKNNLIIMKSCLVICFIQML